MSDKYSKRRLAGATLTTIVSLALVLFMLGLLGVLILKANQITNHIRENIGFQIILNENAKEADIAKLQKTLDVSSYARSTEFISKEEAAARLKEDLGEDFIEFLGTNPLLATINVHLKAEYANADSIAWIKREIEATHLCKEFIYQKMLIDNINETVKKISLGILIFCGLLMIVALALINNTIRLSIYSKRFIIKTMQLVGATQGFIRRPFVLTGIKHGVYGAVIAILLLLALINFAEKQIPELQDLRDQQMLMYLFGLVIIMGIIISWISTSLAVRKYLRLKSDELYY
ncbi:MAG TPA: permease-like cell division protein FtsX [Bacteroidia bacterium]|nr:permease-like cell division protein FtsX [Bacteroidia bacterium]